jgi:hypothetical protein
LASERRIEAEVNRAELPLPSGFLCLTGTSEEKTLILASIPAQKRLLIGPLNQRLRLRRRTLRKGSAFPVSTLPHIS